MAAIYQWFPSAAGGGGGGGGPGSGICDPAFYIYRTQAFASGRPFVPAQFRDGYRLAWGGAAWTAPAAAASKYNANGGWYHLADVYDSLNNQVGVTKCDIITWYGNANSFCEDQVWSFGGQSRDNDNHISNRFFYQGTFWLTPENVLGACIQPVGGTDYYYILTNGYTGSNPDPETDGVDDQIWRKPVADPSHATTGWVSVGTVPYTDYATVSDATTDPIPQSTAYVDADGIAWYTKVFHQNHLTEPNGNTNVYEYALMKVNLVTGAHEIFDSNVQSPLTGSNVASGTQVMTGAGTPNIGTYARDHTERRDISVTGEVYMCTLGGLEARYDLYVSVNHTENYDYDWNPRGARHVGSGYYAVEIDPTKTWILDSDIDLVIKKNGTTIRTVELFDHHESFSSSGTQEWSNDGAASTAIYSAYVNSFATPLVVTQRQYLFLHPHMPTEDIYIQRTMDIDVWDDLGTDVIEMSVRRGAGTVLQTFSASDIAGTIYPNDSIGSSVNRWYDDDTSVLPEECYSWVGASFSDTLSGAWYNTVRSGVDFHRRPPMIIDIDPAQTNVAHGITGNPGNTPIGYLSSCMVGFTVFYAGYNPASPLNRPISSYGHQAQFGTASTFMPAYSGVSRPLTEFGDWQYLLQLQDVALTPGLTSSVGLVLMSSKMPQAHTVLSSAVHVNDIVTPVSPFYVISHSGETWTTGQAMVADETVYHNAYVYNCILNHTSNVSAGINEPGVGSSWQTYWELKPTATHFRSNFITQTTLNGLTGLPTNQDGILLTDIGVD